LLNLIVKCSLVLPAFTRVLMIFHELILCSSEILQGDHFQCLSHIPDLWNVTCDMISPLDYHLSCDVRSPSLSRAHLCVCSRSVRSNRIPWVVEETLSSGCDMWYELWLITDIRRSWMSSLIMTCSSILGRDVSGFSFWFYFVRSFECGFISYQLRWVFDFLAFFVTATRCVISDVFELVHRIVKTWTLRFHFPIRNDCCYFVYFTSQFQMIIVTMFISLPNSKWLFLFCSFHFPMPNDRCSFVHFTSQLQMIVLILFISLLYGADWEKITQVDLGIEMRSFPYHESHKHLFFRLVNLEESSTISIFCWIRILPELWLSIPLRREPEYVISLSLSLSRSITFSCSIDSYYNYHYEKPPWSSRAWFAQWPDESLNDTMNLSMTQWISQW
jgi:hypothetical protein